jgi:anti-sigma factor (TIGR02949 family)
MTCQEALNLLYDIIDKEASQIDIHQVKAHLANCRDCAGVYRVETAVNELVRERLNHPEQTPRLEVLKTRVLNQLDDIDRQMQTAPGGNPNSAGFALRSLPRPGRILAIAASVIIVLGAVYFGNEFLRHQQVYVPLEKCHCQMADNLHTYRDPSVAFAAASTVQDQMGYELEPRVFDLDLVGAQIDVVAGVEMAHFVYANEEVVVSVFVADASQFQIPDGLLESGIDRHNLTFYDHNCRGCRLVFHKIGNAVVITASTEREMELLDFVPGRGTI